MSLEVVSYFTTFYNDKFPLINELVCRFAYGFAIIYVGVKECYFLALHNNEGASTIIQLLKSNWKYKCMFIVLISTLIIFLILLNIVSLISLTTSIVFILSLPFCTYFG